MKGATVGILLALVGVICAGVGASMRSARAGPPTIQQLEFMAGCWRGKPKQAPGIIEETFTTPEGQLILGTSRVVVGKQAVFWELMRIEPLEKGVTMTLLLKTGKTDWFLLRSARDKHAIFENPMNDFPRRISYKVRGTQLDVRVEGQQEGKPRLLAFEMQRVRCPGAPQ
jgi:hypothetical protein